MVGKTGFLKRGLFFFLMLVMVLSVLPVCSAAAEPADTAPEYEAESPEETPEEEPEEEPAEDWRTWSQKDDRWAGIRLGKSWYTIKSSGCLVTSITKLAVQAGLVDPAEFDVGTMANLLNEKGGYTGGGLLYWGTPAKCVPGLTYYGSLLSFNYYSSSSSRNTERILNWIREGYHLVISVESAGHWVAVDEAKSLETGKIYIMDSLGTKANADITLASRYPTFNSVKAYTGGETAWPKEEKAAGDANGDGKIGTADLAMLRRCLANMDAEAVQFSAEAGSGADVNGDGVVNTVDLSILRRYLANLDPITGESSVVLGSGN